MQECGEDTERPYGVRSTFGPTNNHIIIQEYDYSETISSASGSRYLSNEIDVST
jgi:hypothetical protein